MFHSIESLFKWPYFEMFYDEVLELKEKLNLTFFIFQRKKMET